MSDSDRTTTHTRRSVIAAGTLSALGVGLMAVATPGTASAASPATTPAPALDLVAALCAEETPESDAQFSEWLTEWKAERDLAYAQHAAIVAQLQAYVPADRHFELVSKLSDVAGDRASLDASLHREIVFRHLPGLAPALRLLWLHALTMHHDQLEACGRGYCADGDNGPY